MKWIEFSESVSVLETADAINLSENLLENKARGIIDAIASTTELAIQYNPELITHQQLIQLVEEIPVQNISNANKRVFEIPVCYDLGPDLQEVLKYTNRTKEQFVKDHKEALLRISYGFAPGFLYMSGMNPELHCPRKAVPRKKIAKGSVGIGGDQTGVYALESPGGWQVVGLTPLKLFDINMSPPTPFPNGSYVKFVAISVDEFENWQSNA